MRYKDTWKRHIPPEKLAAYKQLLEEAVINSPHVVYSKSTKVTIVEYDSELSHNEVLGEMKARIRAREELQSGV